MVFMNVKSLLYISGFTAVDVLGHGTLGHIAGVGIILGLKVFSFTTPTPPLPCHFARFFSPNKGGASGLRLAPLKIWWKALSS